MSHNYTFTTIFRSILDSKQFQNETCFKVWMWCLLKKADRPYMAVVGRQQIQLEAGQFIFGRHKASLELNMKESTVWDWMKWLERDKSLDIKSNNKFSVISVSNHQKYRDILDSKLDNKSTTNQHKQVNISKSSNNTVEQFDTFWKEYPKKLNKQKTLDFWTKLNPDDLLVQEIMKGLARAKLSPDWRKDGGRFIPYPSTWLNGRRWEDEIISQDGHY